MTEYSLTYLTKYKGQRKIHIFVPKSPSGFLFKFPNLQYLHHSVSLEKHHFSVLNMSSISRFYAEIFNFSGISIGYGGAFPEIRKYHHQDLMGDEVLVSLHEFSDAPV